MMSFEDSLIIDSLNQNQIEPKKTLLDFNQKLDIHF